MFPAIPGNTNSEGLQATIPGVDASEVLVTVLDERVSSAGRFEVVIADPNGERYSQLESIIGAEIEVQTGAGDPFKGRVWGRRLCIDSSSGGSQCVLFGFDTSHAMKGTPRFRVFPPGDFEQVAGAVCEPYSLSLQMPTIPPGRLGQSSTLVQYNESDFAFLYRLAWQSGMHVWPFRSELWIGAGPGSENTIELDAAHGEDGVRVIDGVEIEDSVFPARSGLVYPLQAVAFEGGIGPEEEDDLEPAGEHEVADELMGQAAWMPAGLALTPGDRDALATAAMEFAERERFHGKFVLHGPLPAGLIPGATVNLRMRRALLVQGATVMGVRQEQRGSAIRNTIFLGRQANWLAATPNLYPAQHIWPAQIAGEYDSRIGTVPVNIVGWHPQSEALSARVVGASSRKEFGTIRGFAPDEFVAVGFEQGNPDAPLILGSMHVHAAPEAPTQPEEVLIALRNAKGTAEVKLTDEGLAVELNEMRLILKAAETTIELDKETATVNSKKIGLAGSKIEMTQGG